MSSQDRPTLGKGWIDRLVAALFCSLAILLLWLLWRDHGRLTREVEELNRTVRQLARAPANAPDARRAIGLAREAIGKGQWDLGQIYLANAITNSPRDLDCIREYASVVLERDGAPIDAVDRLSSMLQLAAYQVDSAQVQEVSSLIERAEQVRKRLLGSQVASAGNADFDPRAEWDRLATAPPDLWKDPAGLSARLQALEDFMSRLDEHADRSPEIRAKAVSEFRRWTEVSQAVRQCGYVEQCLRRLQDGEDLASQRAVAVVQAAENALPAFWGLDARQFPAELRATIDRYPQTIQDLVGRIGKARSGPVLDQIRQALAGDVAEERPWQDKCQKIEGQIQRAQHLVVQLSSADAMKEAQGLIEERTKLLRKLRNKQFSDYQQWVINRCSMTFEHYMTYNLGLSEGDARQVFRENKLGEIDQSLLSPEVARAFNDILGKLIGEMGPRALVRTEHEMGITKKKRLEEF